MAKTCTECSRDFDFIPQEIEAYQKFQIPLPENCQYCRHRRRLAFRNERKIYYNTSDLSGKKIIALYSQKSPFKVVNHDEWISDDFDAGKYGRDFDFSRPFFEQFAELQRVVPRWGRLMLNSENSEYTNNVINLKNSYLSFSCDTGSDLYYCVYIYHCNDMYNCMNSYQSDYCSALNMCRACNNVHYAISTENCSDSYFLFDCLSCRHCILCSDLKHKEYHILNQPYSKEDYEKFKKDFLEKLHTNPQEIQKMFDEIRQKMPKRTNSTKESENSEGDLVLRCKNVFQSNATMDSQDCTDLYKCIAVKDCHECACIDHSELCFECDTCYELYNCQFCTYITHSNDSQYCDQCTNLKNCFGCVGLDRQQYMILNKKYSPEEYEKMLTKITEHMKETGEYGKPFPVNFTSFAYNDTLANYYFPITKEQAQKEGFYWNDEEMAQESDIQGTEKSLPADTRTVDRSITDSVLKCEISGKPYKILPKEFDFYHKNQLPLPRLCPEERYKKAFTEINSIFMRPVNCAKCGSENITAYPEDTPYTLYCQECYLKSVY